MIWSTSCISTRAILFLSLLAGAEDVESSSIHINYEDLIHDVDMGDIITVDNGLINLEVLSKTRAGDEGKGYRRRGCSRASAMLTCLASE